MTGHANRQSWALRAICRGYSLEVFFSESVSGIRHAKQICGVCPVRKECLDEVLRAEDGSRYGVYGGMSASERTQLVKSMTEAAEPVRPEPVTRSGRAPAKCGTRSGYQRHLRERSRICAPCRQANTDAYNRLVRTGTTRAYA